MESLIATIVILLLSVLANWAQKKSQSDQNDTPGGTPESKPRVPRQSQPRPSAPAHEQPPKPRAWPQFELEGELRRLLRGDTDEPPRPAVEPPPVIRPEPARPSPRSIVVTRPMQSPQRPHAPSPAPITTARVAEGSIEGSGLQPELAEATAAYNRAGQLHEEMAHRLKEVTDRTRWQGVRLGESRRELAAEELAETLALIRSPSGVRKAVIATVILGSPKGLQS